MHIKQAGAELCNNVYHIHNIWTVIQTILENQCTIFLNIKSRGNRKVRGDNEKR